MIRASFESDYNNGCLPEILRRLSETNDKKSRAMVSTLIPKGQRTGSARRAT